MPNRDVAAVMALRALEGDRRHERGSGVAVLVCGHLAPGIGATGVGAADVVDEGDVDAAREDEVAGYVLEGLTFSTTASAGQNSNSILCHAGLILLSEQI